ncbi:MAG: sigma-70 family RNA polymerase sigma factor [Planctomycetaceae bacterium]|nr:sigma-70 family RNA polymerase sigma factor [Planctomycetaceae bacterium]
MASPRQDRGDVAVENQPIVRQPLLTAVEAWVDHHADYLFRYARSRVRQQDIAEDLVQETFLAALHARERFAGASTERTWLVGILRRKIVDHYRRQHRELAWSDVTDAHTLHDSRFDAQGNWKSPPGHWPTAAGNELENQEFWATFKSCLQKLPERMASAFTLRELEELDGSEVCEVLNVSSNNLWVMLHRARASLVRCLEINWFGEEKRNAP